MSSTISVRKSSGENQEFSEEKLYSSLKNSGASDEMIHNIINEIKKNLFEGIPTKNIYRKAFQLLRAKVKSTASRYSLKQAILEIGPTGYPFEKYIGALLGRMGYHTLTGQIIQGQCVSHEIDVIAGRENQINLIECKYHNTAGKICSVQIPLYIQSRFLDVKAVLEKKSENSGKNFQGWVVTNTRFSEDAADYGKCIGLHLVGWDYPRRGSLKELIETTGLYPVTVISGLNKKQKQLLIDNDFLLCSDLKNNEKVIDLLNLNHRQKASLLNEIKELS
ncbi:MAG: restriction endonuclease [Lentimicrobium sp.]|nr:restriction endonuclease [Lentimicrobium sp.]